MDKDEFQNKDYDFLNGAVLLVNKPKDWTSFDVVNKIRFKIKRLLKVKKIKVGHAGTLDPMATGLLIICTGKFTKRIDEFQGMPKSYEGTLTLGATTPSYDAETEIDEIFPTAHISPALIEEKRQLFLGNIEQYPPMFSAIKVDGQPLYKKARQGIKLDVKPRPVSINAFNITKIDEPKNGIIGNGKNRVEKLSKYHNYDFRKYKGKQPVCKIAANLVHYETGKTIFQTALGIMKSENTTQISLF